MKHVHILSRRPPENTTDLLRDPPGNNSVSDFFSSSKYIRELYMIDLLTHGATGGGKCLQNALFTLFSSASDCSVGIAKIH